MSFIGWKSSDASSQQKGRAAYERKQQIINETTTKKQSSLAHLFRGLSDLPISAGSLQPTRVQLWNASTSLIATNKQIHAIEVLFVNEYSSIRFY